MIWLDSWWEVSLTLVADAVEDIFFIFETVLEAIPGVSAVMWYWWLKNAKYSISIFLCLTKWQICFPYLMYNLWFEGHNGFFLQFRFLVYLFKLVIMQLDLAIIPMIIGPHYIDLVLVIFDLLIFAQYYSLNRWRGLFI